jgi:Domain of unknown function (DUF4160)
MPTLLFINGFRFFFYSNENNEPIHVHIEKGNANGKVWLEFNIEIAYMYGFSNKEIKEIMEIIDANYSQFKIKWNEHFGK